jgi:hypothetical protein
MFRLKKALLSRSTILSLVALLALVAVVGAVVLVRSDDSVDRLRRFLESDEKYESLLLIDVVYPLSERMMWILPWKEKECVFTLYGTLQSEVEHLILYAVIFRLGLEKKVCVNVRVPEGMPQEDQRVAREAYRGVDDALDDFLDFLGTNVQYKALVFVEFPYSEVLEKGRKPKSRHVDPVWDYFVMGKLPSHEDLGALVFVLHQLGLQERVDVGVEIAP